MQPSFLRLGAATAIVLVLAACDDQGFDFDLRRFTDGNTLDTTAAVREATIAPRPEPDDRGVISYPNYQVAVAERGDTVVEVAARVGLPVQELAEYNGLPLETPLRRGELVALPRRVAEPSPETGSRTTGPILSADDASVAAASGTGTVDVESLAGEAIDRAEADNGTPRIATGEEPVRHQVERGETAYTISRRYGVPVAALAEWNGLDDEYTVREGQYLLIPVAEEAPPDPEPAPPRPGEGSPTPTPPSADDPMPDSESARPGAAEDDVPESPGMASDATSAADTGARMIYPVTGTVVRAYQKGRNDGIDISVPAGTPVKAADDGEVAAITRDTDQVPILVLRHADNVLTVYAGVDDIAVNRGDRVRRGQEIARVRDTGSPELHFEVREGFESVDPVLYLE